MLVESVTFWRHLKTSQASRYKNTTRSMQIGTYEQSMNNALTADRAGEKGEKISRE